MTTFLDCWQQEFGLFSLIWQVLVVVVALGVVLVLIYKFVSARQRGELEILSTIRLGGPARLIAMLGAIAIVSAFSYVIFDRALSTRVTFNSETAPVTLKRIAKTYNEDTRVKIVLDEAIANFEVRGTYRGRCVGDMIGYICRQYQNDLVCESGEQEIRISKRI